MSGPNAAGPGHSEQGTWCISWNGGQTEGTSHAHGSWPWAWTKLSIAFRLIYFVTLQLIIEC